jgi:hypothetical protein
MIQYFIIEHATRGVLLEWAYDYKQSTLKRAFYKPKFSYTCLRTDPKVKRYWTDSKAIADRNRLAAIPNRSKVTGAYVCCASRLRMASWCLSLTCWVKGGEMRRNTKLH